MAQVILLIAWFRNTCAWQALSPLHKDACRQMVELAFPGHHQRRASSSRRLSYKLPLSFCPVEEDEDIAGVIADRLVIWLPEGFDFIFQAGSLNKSE